MTSPFTISVLAGIEDAIKGLNAQQKQVMFAAGGALNDVAFSSRAKQIEQFKTKFENATPATFASVRVFGKASRTDLQVAVGLTDLGTKSGAAGMDAERTIGHHFYGGVRKFKRFEAAFYRLGYLAQGENIVPAKDSWAITLDRFGNIKGGFIVQLISYFAGFSEQGYKANMTDRRKTSLAKVERSKAGFLAIRGVVYFVVPSRSRQSGQGRFDQHLHPGIWAKRGTHGSDIAPVVLFVPRGQYQQRFDLRKVVQDTVDRDFAASFSRRRDAAMRTER